MMPIQSLTTHEIREIAVRAICDPRTVRSYAEGRARGMAVIRIERALKDLGLEHLKRVRRAEFAETTKEGAL